MRNREKNTSHIDAFREKLSLNDFEPLKIKIATGGHVTHLFRKKDTGEIWYIKEAYSATEPIELEIIAGEIFRLFLGKNHPRTRYIEDELKRKFIGVEGVIGFANFSEIDFKIERHHTFAHILITAMVLGETDLKADNIGVNQLKEVIKIDNDAALWPIVAEMIGFDVNNDKNKINFTEEDLDNPLFPKNYQVSSWAGDIPEKKRNDFASNPEFNTACSFQMLKIILCPTDLLYVSVLHNSYENSDIQFKVLNFLKERISLLNEKALLSSHFQNYFKEQLTVNVLEEIYNEYVEYAIENIYSEFNKKEYFVKIAANFRHNAEVMFGIIENETDMAIAVDHLKSFIQNEFSNVNQLLASAMLEENISTLEANDVKEPSSDSQTITMKPIESDENSAQTGVYSSEEKILLFNKKIKEKPEDLTANDQYRDNLKDILSRIESHDYKTYGGGVKFNEKLYTQSAFKIKCLIENTLNNPKSISHKMYDRIAYEIELELFNKNKNIKGSWFFGLGKRDESTDNLYDDIIKMLSPIILSKQQPFNNS